MTEAVDFDSVRSKISKLKNDAADANDRAEHLEQSLKEKTDLLEAETTRREEVERKLQTVEGDAFSTQEILEENIKELKNKLETEENKSSELEREVGKMRMENEQLEKSLTDMEQKHKDMVDSLGAAMADLNNV
ncbi:tropomyosin-like [Watersipora subatra]|uniref:tropomyosin-like n=1 Tax=Watersipora subatra TaxID=2589382 RepID=UPI00355C7AA2